MEKEGHKEVSEELVFEEYEEEEVGLLLRGSKPNLDTEISQQVKNSHVEKNGCLNSHSETENGDKDSNFDEEGAEIKECCKPRLESYCVHYDKDEGGELTSVSSAEESNERNPGDVSIKGSVHTDLQYHGNSKDENLSNFNTLPTDETLLQESGAVHKSSNVDEIESADVDLISDDEIDAKDYDVENVLKKQNTHDLYCPNCHSCITRRVILRKRKRKVRNSSEDVKRNKLEITIGSKPDVSYTQQARDQGHDKPLTSLGETPISSAVGCPQDNEPEIFRCLSCFSFFIPTGSGFKLFRIFGGDKEKVQGKGVVENNKVTVPSSNSGDQSNLSSSIQKPTPHIPVDSSSIGHQESGANFIISQNNVHAAPGKAVTETADISDSAVKGKQDSGAGDPINRYGVDTNYQLNVSNGSNENIVNGAIKELPAPSYETQVSTETHVDGILSASQTGLKISITSNSESLTLQKKQDDTICDREMQKKSPDDEAVIRSTSPISVLKGSERDTILDISEDTPQELQQHTVATSLSEPVVQNKDAMFQIGAKDGSSPYEVSQHTINSTKLEIHSKDPLNLDMGALISSVQDALSLQDKPLINQNLSKGEIATTIAENGTIITVGPAETAEPTNVQDVETQIRVVQQQGVSEREGKEIEIIKSIVYGGLAEIITSLSIVSAAAASDTATLYIFVLGVANLFGGIIIILNNLWELKKDRFEQASNQIMEQADRYRELLGRRENFTVHAIVAVVSYIIFGLVPPTVYAFSFHKSDDREFKLLVVAATSLLCIIALASAKVYTQRPPKSYLKTIMFFVVLGFMVSGVSFGAGELIKRVLQKLGWLQGSSEVNLLQPGVTRADAESWASY